MKLDVQLQPHTATQGTPIGPVEVSFDQYRVVVNGHRAGFVHTQGGSVKLTIQDLPVQVQKDIQAKVDDLIAELVEAPTPSSAPVTARVIPDETTDVGDESDDSPMIDEDEF